MFTIGQGCAAFSKSRNILLFALQLFMALPLTMNKIEIEPLESVLSTGFTGKRALEIKLIQNLVWFKFTLTSSNVTSFPLWEVEVESITKKV